MSTRQTIDLLFEEADAWQQSIKGLLDDTRRELSRNQTRKEAQRDWYSWYQISLWLSNSEELSDRRLALARSLGGDEEDGLQKVDSDLEQLIYAEDDARAQKAIKRFKKAAPDPDDPLAHIKEILRGKEWPQARRAFIKNFSSDSFNMGRDVSRFGDDRVAQLWRTVYNAATRGRYTNINQGNPFTVADFGRELSNNDQGRYSWDREEIKHHLQPKGDWNGKVKVYRGTPRADSVIRPGDYCTTDRDYARSYAAGKFGGVVTALIPTKDLQLSSGGHQVHLVYLPASETKDFADDNPMMSLKQFWAQVNNAQ
jgi:hypothetical protein